MADVFGIPPTDPNDYSEGGGSAPDNKVMSALLSTTSKILEHNKNIDKNVKVISAIFESRKINSNNKESEALVEELKANTIALQNLSDILKQDEIKFNVTSESSQFFKDFIKVAKSKKAASNIERFGLVFGNTLDRIVKLSAHTKKIDKLSKSLTALFKPFTGFSKNLLLASGALAIFGVTMITFISAMSWESILKFGAIITAVTLASRLIGKSKWNFGIAAASIALFGVAIATFNKLIDGGEGVKFAGNLLLVGGAIALFNELITRGKGFGKIGKNKSGMLSSIVTIAAIGGAVWLFNKAIADLQDFDVLVVTKTVLAIGATAGVFYIIGKGVKQIAVGAAAAAAVGAGLAILSYGLDKILSISREKVDNGVAVGAAAVIAIGVLGLIGAAGPVALAIGIGAAAAAAVGAGLTVLAHGLESTLRVKIDKDRAHDFKDAITYTLGGLMQLGKPWVAAAFAFITPASLAMSASSIALSGGLNAISKTKNLSKTKLKSFGENITTLADTFGGLSIKKNLKAGVNMAILTPLAMGATLMVGVIQLFSSLKVDQDKISYSLGATSLFVEGISNIFHGSAKKMPSVVQGIASFMGISGLAKSIADTVKEIANLEFFERKIVNGKSVIVGSTKLSVDDFKRVGESIGALLNAITEPLANIGGSKNSYSIGGYTITNPFSNKIKSGISAMTNIGKVFTPLSGIIKTFAVNGINSSFINTFNHNLASVLGGIGVAFTENSKQLKAANRIKNQRIVGFISTLSQSIGSKEFKAGAPIFSTFAKDLISVKNTINSFDIERLTKFSGMIENLNEMAKLGAIKELVDKFGEFIDKFSEFTDQNQRSNYNESSITNNYGPQLTPIASTPTTSIGPVQDMDITLTKDDINNLIETLDQLKRLFIDGSAKVTLNEALY